MIDKKGKLFGVVNIVDFIFILSLVAFIILVFLGYKALTKNRARTYVWMNVDCQFEDVIPELAKVMRKGDTAKDETGADVGGRLNSILSVRPSNLVVLIGNEPARIAPHPFRKDISANLSLKCRQRSDGFYYGDYCVKIGNKMMFSPERYSALGMIIDIKEKDVQ